MGEFRLEKRRVRVALTLSTGQVLDGHLFLADLASTHSGPERVGDLLNSGGGFFPFEVEEGGEGPSRIALYNRAHVVLVHLAEPELEAELDPTYLIADRKSVSMLLSTGARVTGDLRLVLPAGHARLSDYARSEEVFRYVELPAGMLIVNFAHVIELLPVAE
jgi:hypothetical protein